ncbi:MAG: tRNA (N6-isopentenyl adenosine(37)-C2)-methylthiotransferase MiaB [Patescibacteria group bacterium]
MKYLVITFGCQMNKNDSERLCGILDTLGATPAVDEAEADLILMNTCSVRQSAEERIYGKMEDFAKLKEKNPRLIIGLTGCMAGRDHKREFLKKMPVVDLYFPTRDMVNLPRWIAELRPELANSSELETDYLKLKPLRVPSAQAFVTIQTGCNRFCAYCVVPYARGLEKNRPAKDILAEIRELAKLGVVEVTLLGQTVNSYRASDPETFSSDNPFSDHFAALLWETNQVPGIARIHWTAAHPTSMTDEVIAALALPHQLNYLHLPVQSGSDEVLGRMNRKYTSQEFLATLRKIQAARPGIALGTDIIVGFPGETPEQFEETVALYRACDFDISYTAQYSPRSGTLAAKLYADDVPREEKRRRWDILRALMEETALRKNQSCVDKVVNVLVEKIQDGSASGNSRELKLVVFPALDQALLGKEVPVRISEALTWQLKGELV